MTRIGCLILILYLSLTWTSALSQRSYKIDSLLRVMEEKGESFQIFYRLSIEFMYYKNDSGFYYSKRAFTLAEQLQDTLKIVDAGRVQANLLRAMEKFDSALVIIRKILPLARRNNFKRQIIYITNVVGIVHIMSARYDSALAYLFESLALRNEAGKPDDISACLANIGLSYYKMKLYTKALDYYEQSIHMAMTSKDRYGIDMMLVNKGMCLVYLKQYEKAIAVIREGMNIVDNNSGAVEISLKTQYMGYFGLGVSYYGKQDFKSAKLNFGKSLKLSQDNLDERLQADNLVYLAKVANSELANPLNALQYLQQAKKLSLRHGYRELLISIYEESIVALKGKSDPGVAVYQQLLINLKQEVYNNQLRENLSLVESALRKKENSLLLEHQAQILRLNEALIDKKEVAVWITSALCFMITVLLAALYRINKFKKDSNVSVEKSILLQTAALGESLLRLQGLKENRRVERDNFLSGLKRHLRTIDGLSYIMNSTANTIEISNAAETLRKLVVVETK